MLPGLTFYDRLPSMVTAHPQQSLFSQFSALSQSQDSTGCKAQGPSLGQSLRTRLSCQMARRKQPIPSGELPSSTEMLQFEIAVPVS